MRPLATNLLQQLVDCDYFRPHRMHCVVMPAVATYVVALSVYAYVCVSVGYDSELCKHG